MNMNDNTEYILRAESSGFEFC